MLAKKCDRCGGYYDCYHGKFNGLMRRVNGIILADINDNSKAYNESKDIELCPNCLNDFQSWMTKTSERGIANAE